MTGFHTGKAVAPVARTAMKRVVSCMMNGWTELVEREFLAFHKVIEKRWMT